MRGFRGKYAWTIGALFVFTGINYVTPLVAGAAIDFALSGEPGEGRLTSGIIAAKGRSLCGSGCGFRPCGWCC